MTGAAWVALMAIVAIPVTHAASLEIHPAGPTIPENLLRFELRFDQPQRLPFDIRHVQLLDGNGQVIERALLDLTLPSADGRRITVLMDPGRVKRGVGPNVDAGRALHAGERVSLRVDDVGGAPSATVKAWQVSAAVSHSLDPTRWQLIPPRAGSRDALVVALREPISSSGEALIAVVDSAGRPVRGTTSLRDGDAVWRFTPQRPWRPGTHRLVTHPALEDPAGNRRCAAFEAMRGSGIRCDEGAEVPFATRAAQ